MVNKVVKAGRIPAVLIGWNIFDALLHVAIDMAEPLRITGNIIAILDHQKHANLWHNPDHQSHQNHQN